MAANLINSLLSLANKLLPSITASAHAHSSSSSNHNNSEKGRAHATEENLEWLMRTLKRIKATLYDAEEREIIDRSVKLWLKELREITYDAENVLSEYRYEVTRLQVEARKTSETSSSQKGKQMEFIDFIVPIPDGMVDRLNKIRSRFNDIVKDREALQLRESDGARRLNKNNLRHPTGHMVDEASVFGRDAEIMKVINFLLSEKEKEKYFSVISIVGKGGIGKTTIAQLVYNDGRVSQCFDLFGWVCVSEELNLTRLIKATIESISTKINYDASELSPLQKELAKIVKGKTILLVLDDVWNENQSLWELFRVPFKEAKMVRILMTTRNKKVSEVMQASACFSPTNLAEDSCWQLFRHYAFSYVEQPHLVDMGMEIMRKCGGLPLAVKSIASLLRHKTDENCWREILESDLWESNPSNDIFPALQISYAHLPPYLKPCFLFCSMYPKDYILKKMNLIELWISHGYIESRGNRKITEIGVEYYEELKQRSFLDDFSSGRCDECCKLHDIIHNLARLNSENEHYSIVINQPLYINEVKVPLEAYHLYVGGYVGYAIHFHQQNLEALRTLSMDLVVGSEGQEGNLTKFEALRVLKLDGYISEIPHSIFKLKHLTYLGITSSRLKMLPLSVGLLYNLQTLVLYCNLLEYIPESIGDLANLQFLNIQSYIIKKLLKSLCSLSNLLRLVIACDNLEEVPLDLRNLHNLHELTIISQLTLALPNTIGCLSSLEEVNFSPLGGRVNYLLSYVPHDLVSFPAIKNMAAVLRVRNIAWLKDMKALEGRLSIEGLEKSNLVDAQHANLKNKCKLEALDLCWNHDPDYDFLPVRKHDLRLRLKIEACEDGLVGENDVDFSLLQCLQPHHNLKKLLIKMYPSATVPGWMSNPFSLESIQEVSLEYCDKIQSFPFGNLHTLKNLKIEECSGIQVLQLEQLPSQLEGLQISDCHRMELITGLGDLDMLASLRIQYCPALKSLMMDRLQLVESTEIFSDSSHEKPHISRQNISSLTSLEIEHCGLLSVLPDGLIPPEPCYVNICGCSCHDLRIRGLQNMKSAFFENNFISPTRRIWKSLIYRP